MITLAEFIREHREKIGLSVYGLSNKANIEVEVLDDIETGKELSLSVIQRQKLARVLKCSPAEIKKYERDYQFDVVSDEIIDELKQKILAHKTNLKCPICGEPLVTRIAEMYDLDDNKVLEPKAHCVKCVFQIK